MSGQKPRRPPPIVVSPTRTVMDPASIPPAELIEEASERLTYSALDEPAEAFERALLALFLPGQLEIANSDGTQEAHELLSAIARLRAWVAVLRRLLSTEFSLRTATLESPAFLHASRRLVGLVAAKKLEPSLKLDPTGDAMADLGRARADAALTLVVFGSKSVEDALATHLTRHTDVHGGEGAYFVETLLLFYKGTAEKPYPLTAAEVVASTEWFPGARKGLNVRIQHEPAKGKDCPHCLATRLPANTLRQRNKRLRQKLAQLIAEGLTTVELGYSVDGDDVRRQTR